MNGKQGGYVYKQRNEWRIRYRIPVLKDGRPVVREDGKIQRQQISTHLAEVAPGDTRLRRPPPAVLVLRDAFMSKLDLRNSRVTDKKDIGFKDFAETIYFVNQTENLADSTLHGYKQKWFQFLEPSVKTLRLKDYDTPRAQQFLRDVSQTPLVRRPETKGQVRSTVQSLRKILSGIFKHAIQEGYHAGPNPIRDTSVPKRVRASVKSRPYCLDETLAMINVLKNPTRVIVALDAFSGLRRGEIFGLDWSKYIDEGRALVVDQSIWEGKIKDTKTRASSGTVPIIATLKKLLDEYRVECGNPTSGPIFANITRTGAFNPNNIVRMIKQVLDVCVCGAAKNKHNGHLLKPLRRQQPIQHPYERNRTLPEWHGFHGFRYGLATNLKALGVDTEVIKQIVRHANSNVTSGLYIKTVTDLQIESMAKLDKVLAERLGVAA